MTSAGKARAHHTDCWKRCARTVFVMLAAFLPLCPVWAGTEQTLSDYIHAPDPTYHYRHVSTVMRSGCKIHVLAMTSQRWRTRSEVNRTHWSHWLAVVVPDGVRSDIGMLIVEGGMNLPFRPSLNNPLVSVAEHIATTTKTTVIAMGQVPNEPLYFSDTDAGLMEDRLVAYSWAKAMDTGDYTWPVYVPMAKSVVRAMDTVQDVMAKVEAHLVQRFVLVGFSKRGAVTWLTAANDTRVMALASGVFDILDIASQIEHHYAAYGKYADELDAYIDYGVVRRLRSPEGEKLMQVVDPYFYRDVVTQPKFLINATGDPFFLPDAARHYLDALHGETLLRYVPNTGHALHAKKDGVTEIVNGLVSWYESLLAEVPRPHITWSLADGWLHVRSTPTPLSMQLWQANNRKARDFREKTIGDTWTSVPLALKEGGESSVRIDQPNKGWRAYFVELHYAGVAGLPQVYSTPVFIVPDLMPHMLVDPIQHPHDETFWKDQIARAQIPDYSAEVVVTRLASYLPLPLFDAYVTDLAAAWQVMATGDNPADQARRQCLVTRLNIAHHDLGWYSRLHLDGAADRYLWQYYRDANAAFMQGEPTHARDLCAAMNRVGASGQVFDHPAAMGK
jgi:PhoPQ-activated pathogenicity-related protein